MRFLKPHSIKAILLSGIFLFATKPFKSMAQTDTDNRVYVVVPQMPTFNGDLDNYMGSHLQYPQSAIDKGIQGTVNVIFLINKKGQVSDVSVLSGVYPDIDSEAVFVVRNMPPWNPGMKDGKVVNVKYNLPVYFQLNNVQRTQPPPLPEQAPVEEKPRDTVFILRDGMYVDPYIGYGNGGPNSSSATSVTRGSNFKFGAGLSYIFPSNIGISIGLQVQQYNFNYTYSNITASSAYNGTITKDRNTANDTVVTGGYNESIKYSFTYAQVPLLCRYISSQENKMGFYAEAGLVVNYLLNSEISGTVTQTQYNLSQAANTYWYMYSSTAVNNAPVSLSSQNAAKLILAFHAAIGFIIPFNNKISLILALSPDLGMMNAGDGSKDIVNFGTAKYYIYGKGDYGSFNSDTFDAKLLIKIFGSSRVVRKN